MRATVPGYLCSNEVSRLNHWVDFHTGAYSFAEDLPRKCAWHLSPSRSLRPRFGLRDRSDDDERDRSRRFFFERLSSLFDRLRLRLFARVTVMNFLFT